MAAKIPFEFVLEELAPLKPRVKAMFGCHAIYVGERIVFILRMRDDFVDDNGVWFATVPQYHESLREDFPSLRHIRLFGGRPTTWQNLPLEADDFEESVYRACARVLKGDPRFGKIPGARRPKRKSPSIKRPAPKKAKKKSPRRSRK